MALLHPSPYATGMSSLGFQWIGHLLAEAGLGVERFFAAEGRGRGPLLSMETESPLSDFPLVAVSLSAESEILELLRCLETSGIPALRARRRPDHPRILLGGPITSVNPRPLAPFVDAMLIGEADETVAPAVTAFYAEGPEAWLPRVASLRGGWVPGDGSPPPERATAARSVLPARSRLFTPGTDLFEMHLVEGVRGCPRACRFCVMARCAHGTAPPTDGPSFRVVDPERILSSIPPEAPRVGLVGAGISDHPELPSLIRQLVSRGHGVGLSSSRADRLASHPEILEGMVRGGARSLTTASDALSQRLRDFLEKGIEEAELLECARLAAVHHLDALKLYLMVGVPGETDDDVEEFASLAKRMAALTPLVLGVAAFVPKPGTALEAAPFLGVKGVDARLSVLRARLGRSVEIRASSSRWAWFEHQMSTGDESSGEAVYGAFLRGGGLAEIRRALESRPPLDARRT